MYQFMVCVLAQCHKKFGNMFFSQSDAPDKMQFKKQIFSAKNINN